MFLKTLATTSYASLVYYVQHVASPRINEAFYHFKCSLKVYMYKKHSSFSFIALLLMPCLSEHKRAGAIGMLKAEVRVSDVACYHNCTPSTEIVTRLLGQLKIDAGLVSQEWRPTLRRQHTSNAYRRYLHRRCPFWPTTVSARRIVGIQG